MPNSKSKVNHWLFLGLHALSATCLLVTAAPNPPNPPTPPSTPIHGCSECITYKEQMENLRHFNENLLKEVFVYRHVLSLDTQDMKQMSHNLKKEIEAWAQNNYKD